MGPEYSSSIMGISHHLKEIDMAYTIYIGIWTRGSHAYKVHFPSMCIAIAMGMNNEAVLEEHVAQLIQLKEDHFIAGFHQRIEKDRQNTWHDHHIKNK